MALEKPTIVPSLFILVIVIIMIIIIIVGCVAYKQRCRYTQYTAMDSKKSRFEQLADASSPYLIGTYENNWSYQPSYNAATQTAKINSISLSSGEKTTDLNIQYGKDLKIISNCSGCTSCGILNGKYDSASKTLTLAEVEGQVGGSNNSENLKFVTKNKIFVELPTSYNVSTQEYEWNDPANRILIPITSIQVQAMSGKTYYNVYFPIQDTNGMLGGKVLPTNCPASGSWETEYNNQSRNECRYDFRYRSVLRIKYRLWSEYPCTTTFNQFNQPVLGSEGQTWTGQVNCEINLDACNVGQFCDENHHEGIPQCVQRQVGTGQRCEINIDPTKKCTYYNRDIQQCVTLGCPNDNYCDMTDYHHTYPGVINHETSRALCTACQPCPGNQYRSGCSGTNPGTCTACPSCPSGRTRYGCRESVHGVGGFSSGLNEGFCCNNCPIGEYTEGCNATNPGTCTACPSCPAGEYRLNCGGPYQGETCYACGEDMDRCGPGKYLSDCGGANPGKCCTKCSTGQPVGCEGGLYAPGSTIPAPSYGSCIQSCQYTTTQSGCFDIGNGEKKVSKVHTFTQLPGPGGTCEVPLPESGNVGDSSVTLDDCPAGESTPFSQLKEQYHTRIGALANNIVKHVL